MYNWSSTFPPDCKYQDSVRYYGAVIDYQCPFGYVFDYNGEENLQVKCETWANWHPAGSPKCIRKNESQVIRYQKKELTAYNSIK